MATIKVRYLTSRPGAPGELPRWFWQPASRLARQGWRMQRVPLNWASFTDADALHSAAITRARELNAEMDRVRASAAIAEARPEPPKAGRTVHDLVVAYQASDEFLKLAPTTARGYRQCLSKIDTWAGPAPVRAIDAERIGKLRKAMVATPAFANAVVRVLRLLLEWGRRHGWVAENVASKPGLTGSDPSGLIWPREAVTAFVAAADAEGRYSMGTAVMLNEWLGQREADILRMPRSIYRNGALVFRQRKTGASVTLPIDMVPHLRQRLADELARQAARDAAAKATGAPIATTIIVNEETGRPYKADTFRHMFAKIRAKAAKVEGSKQPRSFELDYLLPGRDMEDPNAFTVSMLDLTFMHLRHTAITRNGEAGCDDALISSISGHALASINTILARYMVRTAEMARGAFQKRMDAEGIISEAGEQKEAEG
jgi:hypothetical protein